MTTGIFDLIAFDKDGAELHDYSGYSEGTSEQAITEARVTFSLYSRVNGVEVRHRVSGLLMATVTHVGVTRIRE